MNKNENGKINIIDRIKSSKKLQIIVIVVISVLMVCFVFIGFSGEKDDNVAEDKVLSYVNDLENRLKNTLCRVEGVGKVSVVITVDSGMETVLANKTTTTGTGNSTVIEETPIIVNGKTVVIKEMYPKITGVLIVAEGAKNIAVMKRIQQATVSLLNISVGQIEILSMK